MGFVRTVKRMREIAWVKLPYMDYMGSLKIKLRPQVMRQPDFPSDLSIGHEIRPTDKVVEIGANVGGNSRDLAKHAGMVYSFEPAPNCYKWLLRNTKGIPNLKCFNLAVSGESRQDEQFRMQYGSGSLFNQDVYDWMAHITVNVIGINELPFDWNVGVIDAEGAEAPILQNLKDYSHIRALYVECHWIEHESTKEVVRTELVKHFSDVKHHIDPGNFDWWVAYA